MGGSHKITYLYICCCNSNQNRTPYGVKYGVCATNDRSQSKLQMISRQTTLMDRK